jgi:hypothetical protein
MQTKNCQNCKKDYEITPSDFSFYEKIKVPPPTFCPWCRFMRRLVWRNERTLYKRSCDLCNKSIISTYPAECAFPVYCTECWYGDKWEAATFGREYDFSRSFFEQFNELMLVVPRFALWQRNSINSDYSNMVAESKNVYLSASVVAGSENIFYSKTVDGSTNIIDSTNIRKSEECYENVEGERNYSSQFLTLSRNCIDSFFLFDCANCSNCFMSSNLRNKQFCIRNVQRTREEYFKELAKEKLASRNERTRLILEFKNMREKAIHRFANIIQAQNSSGNNISNARNCTHVFEGYDIENLKYAYRGFTSKDCMDYDFGQTSELMYEYLTGALNDSNVKFSFSAMGNVSDAEYVFSCISASNIFGCTGIKNKKYAILNKIYSKEEFEQLRTRIIEHMNTMPYVDQKGRVYKYGEFFPMDISPFSYNETLAQEFDPLSGFIAEEKGYKWKEPDAKSYKVTIEATKIPDNIHEVTEKIIEEALGCQHAGSCSHQCSVAFRITQGELQFYKKHSIPIPDKCSNCRYYERLAQVPLPKLYKRTCMKCEKMEFETPYAPERPEKIYCESCYNKEVY